jgi:hypothetical protein
MTCRDEVVAAFERLRASSGRCDFLIAEVVDGMRAAGSAYPVTTIRTQVAAHMVQEGTRLKVGHGRYRLALHRDRPLEEPPRPVRDDAGGRVSEDEVKAALKSYLEVDGWTVTVAWGRERGIDIEARRGNDRLLIEAKGEAPAGAQQVNYFLGALGELVQRMSDPDACYALALPGHRQYRGLVDRLPALAKERLGIVFFVGRDGVDMAVRCVPPELYDRRRPE